MLEASLHAFAGDSDSATVLLEGAAISHGHVGLHGWSLTADSFWSIDAIFYAAATLVVGVRAVLMNAVPSVIAALIIATGALLAAQRLNRRGQIAASVFVVVALGLPGPVLAYFLLQGPWHVGTTLWCLLAFYALSRRPTRLNFAAAVALLAAGILGDPMTIAIGCVPIVLWGLMAAATATGRSWRRPIYAVGGAVAVAFALRGLAYALGGFAMVNRQATVKPSQMAWNLADRSAVLAALFGVATLPTHTPHAPAIFHAARLVVALAIVSGFAATLYRLVTRLFLRDAACDESLRLDELLVIAFLADLVAFVLLSPGPAVNNVRYLIPAAILGAILGARLVGHAVASLRARRQIVAAGLVGLVLLGCSVVGPFDLLRSSRPTRPATVLTAFLEKQGLTDGIGDYWSSSIITVDSREQVLVRPVITNGHDRIIRDDRQSDASWYSHRRFEFLVYNVIGPGNGVDLASARATFGTPAHIYTVGTYRIIEWATPVGVSAALKSSRSPLRGYWEP